MKLKRKINIFFNFFLIKPKRIINLLKIYYSKIFKKTKITGLPHTIMIEPTNYCNLKCPLCPTGAGLIKRKPENLSFEDFKKILDNAGDQIVHLRLWNWGEPLLNKNLAKMIKYAKSKKIFVNTSTNAFFLNKKTIEQLISSGLDQLIVSLDGASEETYKKYRKQGSFKEVVDSLKKISNLKNQNKINKPEVKLQFIVMKHNEHEIPKVIELAKKTNVDTLFIKTVGVMDPQLKKQINNFLPKNKKYRRYMLEESNPKDLPLVKGYCDYLWSEITVNVDGSVVPCCRDAHGKFVFGNLKKQNIKQIWNSPKLAAFRKKVLTNKNQIPICKTCSGSNEEFSISEINLK